MPVSDRWHKTPTPDSGGIAIFASLLIAYLLGSRGLQPSIAWACVALWLCGTLDDRFRFRARSKFLVQAVIITFVVGSGVVFHLTTLRPVNILFTWLWLVGITNAFNLIDNMDGLAAGVAIIIGGLRAALLLSAGYVEDAAMCGAVAAAFAGFLVYNVNPARIFMGDGGSLLGGFCLGALTVVSPLPHTRSLVAGFFYPTLTFAYPIFDAALVTVLRRSAGRPIAVGGRDHTSHRLASIGLHERKVVWILWIFTTIGSGIGILLHHLPMLAGVLVMLLVVFGTLFAIFLATLPTYPFSPPRPLIGMNRSTHWLPSLRAGISVLVDSLLAGIALVAAFLLRFDLTLPQVQSRNLLLSVPLVIFLHAIASTAGRSYGRLWNHFEIDDLWPFLRATILGVGTACAVLSLSFVNYPRSVLVLYPVLTFGLCVSIKSFLTVLRHLLRGPRHEGGEAVAIFRADEAGKSLVRYLQASSSELRPVAFLEGDTMRNGGYLCGLPILTLDSSTLEQTVRLLRIKNVIVAGTQDPALLSHAAAALARADVTFCVMGLQLTSRLNSGISDATAV
jgi:UDP-GlcNAc:undecaprenyl-phosphate GlcNAc-1-phosphate transferase